MKKIINPYASHKSEDYNCFGCSPGNEIGLNLEFWDTGEELITKWMPDNKFMGYKNVLHGGLQSTIMDEIASWVVYTRCDTAGVTSALNINYLKPVYISRGQIEVRAKLVDVKDNIATIKCQLIDGEGNECTIGDVKYFCLPRNIAVKKYQYPGSEVFYE